MKEEDNLSEFELSEEVKEKLKDQKLLQQELSEGKTAQEILGFSDETMAKFYRSAYHLFENRRYQEAANAFFFLATLLPSNHEYWLGLGMATQMNGQFEEAIDAYELAAYYKIDSPVPYFYLAKCLFAVHDRQASRDALDLAIEYAGDKAEYEALRKEAIKARKLLDRNTESKER